MTSIQIRLIEYGLIMTTAVLGYFAWHHHVYQQGYDDCKAVYTEAAKKAANAANAKIKKVEVEYESHKKTVYQIQGDNPAVGPRVDAALRGMSERSGHR